MIRPVKKEDFPQLSAIYNHYIENSIATFEEKTITTCDMEERVNGVLSEFPWLVYESNGEVVGYAYAHLWQERSAYRYSVASAVYLLPDNYGKGIGSQLYEKLFEELRKTSCHAVIAGISLPNDSSVALHEKFGFEKVAQFKEVGKKFGQWIDVGYWELILEGGENEN